MLDAAQTWTLDAAVSELLLGYHQYREMRREKAMRSSNLW
jgi:hypothetical protein